MPLQTRIWHHFQEFFLQNGKISEAFLRLRNAKKSISTFARFLSRNAIFFALKAQITFIVQGKVQKVIKFYIPQSQKSLRDSFESKSGNSVNNFQGAWGDFVIFCAKSDFCAKMVQFSPKSENEVNGTQNTKKTVTFIRVGAMRATMSYSAPKVRNFEHFAILEPEIFFYTFGSKIWIITFFRCSWRRKGLGSCSSPKERYAFLRKNVNFPENLKIHLENRITQEMFPFCKSKSW